MSEQPHLSRTLVTTLALTGALSVANLYYGQPLLAEMGRDFAVDVEQIGYIPTLTQIGYAVGLLLFVPLGDIVERKRLILAMTLATAVALVGTALAPNAALLAVASFLVGMATIVPQLVLPFTAQLAPPEERGRLIGLVMGGLLVGILAARTVSGFIGAALGWRAMYWIAAALMVGLAVALRFLLPVSRPATKTPYLALFRSIAQLIRDEPVLREASLLGGLAFGAFSAFWATLVFRLETPPLHYGARAAGLFGLVGIAGALAAPIIGRVADRRSPRFTSGLGISIALLSFGVFALGGATLAGLALGVVLLDVGVQANQVSNQARIYALIPEARNRLNTVYMVSYFIGGALGTKLGTSAWGLWKWPGVCAVGALLLLMATGLFGAGARARPVTE